MLASGVEGSRCASRRRRCEGDSARQEASLIPAVLRGYASPHVVRWNVAAVELWSTMTKHAILFMVEARLALVDRVIERRDEISRRVAVGHYGGLGERGPVPWADKHGRAAISL